MTSVVCGRRSHSGSVGFMCDALRDQRAVVGPLPDKLAPLEQRDPSSLSFSQTAKLVGMGRHCRRTDPVLRPDPAEAELMSKLHKN